MEKKDFKDNILSTFTHTAQNSNKPPAHSNNIAAALHIPDILQEHCKITAILLVCSMLYVYSIYTIVFMMINLVISFIFYIT